ncbi:MAG TPA: anhydro-N-acetylmuramic acid kinase, partial [Casimicrobiaceae bacterium]|nr:anhydro-N-acetylmuramic acid kinase [Casimicrobiaceae bacterium]
LDGVDAVLADFRSKPLARLAAVHVPFPPALRDELGALQRSGSDEIHRGALASNSLMDCFASAVHALLTTAKLPSRAVAAIGMHGQTIRHRPELGYTVQLANPARLAEETEITVVADFRSRDVAAGGQGAPLVPAFHAMIFGSADAHRAVVNLGGIANVTDLPPDGPVRGFDAGPGNTLLDTWCERHTGKPFDRDGAWASTGNTIGELLLALEADPYFKLPPPKSTGRDYFNLDWLERHLKPTYAPADVQRTLVALTARTVVGALDQLCSGAAELLVCGGGANNALLIREVEMRFAPRPLRTTAEYGVPVNEVEALAFAWLARETLAGRTSSLPSVTGARGERVLGAIYPA